MLPDWPVCWLSITYSLAHLAVWNVLHGKNQSLMSVLQMATHPSYQYLRVKLGHQCNTHIKPFFTLVFEEPSRGALVCESIMNNSYVSLLHFLGDSWIFEKYFNWVESDKGDFFNAFLWVWFIYLFFICISLMNTFSINQLQILILCMDFAYKVLRCAY